jgi:hypothetical protein
MDIHLHLYTPEGDANRRHLEQGLQLVLDDNALWFQGMMSSGRKVHASPYDAGIRYIPHKFPDPIDEYYGRPLLSHDQHFYCVADTIYYGYGACGEFAAWSGGYLRAKTGKPVYADVILAPWLGPGGFHCRIRLDSGRIIDPSRRGSAIE